VAGHYCTWGTGLEQVILENKVVSTIVWLCLLEEATLIYKICLFKFSG
jgi:hypothetical protein